MKVKQVKHAIHPPNKLGGLLASKDKPIRRTFAVIILLYLLILIRKGGISWSFLDWIRLDPHPPLSWRIKRLDEIEDTSQIKHTFLKSVGDVFKGFFSSLT